MMALLRNKWLWVFGAGLALSGALLLVVVGYVALLAYSAVTSGAPIVPVLLDIALPVLGSVAVLVAVLALSGVGLLWVVVQNASLPRSDRVATLLERVEQAYPPLRKIGLSTLVAPPAPSAEEQADQALAALKHQYVSGEITEAEFERKVDRLVANESIDEVRAAHERKRVKDDTARSNRIQ